MQSSNPGGRTKHTRLRAKLRMTALPDLGSLSLAVEGERNMFGKLTLRQEHAKIIKQIEEGERQPPQHRMVRNIRDKGFQSFATPSHDVFFEHFKWFGVIMNQEASEPWTIEEIDDPLINAPGADMPELGRHYIVYYNGLKVGSIQCGVAGMDWAFEHDKYAANPQADAMVRLNWLKFIPWEDALALLTAVVRVIGVSGEYEETRRNAETEAIKPLTGYMWEAMRDDTYVPDFYWHFEGPFQGLRLRTEHWEKNGIDPFEKWNGDRSWSPENHPRQREDA